MSAPVDAVAVLRGLAALAGYRLKDKRQRVMRDLAHGRPVHPETACTADRAEYLRDQAMAAAHAVEELLAAIQSLQDARAIETGARHARGAFNPNPLPSDHPAVLRLGAAHRRLAAALARLGVES